MRSTAASAQQSITNWAEYELSLNKRLGLDNQKIVQTFYDVVDLIVETAGAEEAVKVAYKIAEKGDTVLLSPACASFDLFDNYEDRGDKFKQAVREL